MGFQRISINPIVHCHSAKFEQNRNVNELVVNFDGGIGMFKRTVFRMKGLISVFGTIAKLVTLKFQRFIVSDGADYYCYYCYDQFKEI